MSTSHEQLRSVLVKGFYSENLLLMARLLAEMRKDQVSNPVACFVIEQVLLNLHMHWFERQPSTVEMARALEGRLIKSLEAILVAMDADPQALLARMNELVRAYDACRQEVPAPDCILPFRPLTACERATD